MTSCNNIVSICVAAIILSHQSSERCGIREILRRWPLHKSKDAAISDGLWKFKWSRASRALCTLGCELRLGAPGGLLFVNEILNKLCIGFGNDHIDSLFVLHERALVCALVACREFAAIGFDQCTEFRALTSATLVALTAVPTSTECTVRARESRS